jgi:LEA14-like dessication related protein
MGTKKAILTVTGVVVLAAVLYLVVKLNRSGKEAEDYIVPEIQLAQMQVTNLTSEKADMNMNMVIDNPAPVGIDIDSLHYVIYIEDNEVVRTTYPDALSIEANDSTNISLPLSLYYDRLESVIQKLEQQGKDSANYKVDATIFSEMALIPKDKLNMSVEKRMPLIRIPEIEIKDLKVNDLGLSGATLNVEALVRNENVFPISFRDMAYSVKIEDNDPVEGHKPGIVHIPAKGSTSITVPAELDLKEMGKSVLDFFRKGDDVRYNFDMTTEMASDAEIIENSEIKINASGKLKTVVDAVKEQKEEEKQ